MNSKSRGTDVWWTLALVCWLLVALAFWQGAFASGYSTGAIPRGSSADVVEDSTAVYGVDANQSVHINRTDRLVTVTNRFGQSVAVTVELRAESEDIGELVLGGSETGDTATFDLGPGESRDVSISIPDNTSFVGRDVRFDLNAETTGLQGTVSNRSVPVKS